MVSNRLKFHGIVMTAIFFAGFAYIFSISCSQKDEKELAAGPVFEVQKIFPVQDEHVHGSTIVELTNGDLLAGWFQGSGERWADDVKIMGSRRKKGHVEWSEPFILADIKEFPDCNPVLFLDGETWSLVQDSELPNPGTSCDIVTLENGYWAIVNNDTEEGRQRLTVSLSEDDGNTWPWSKIISDTENTRSHYPALIIGKDGLFHVTYSFFQEDNRKTIKYAVFNEEWLRGN